MRLAWFSPWPPQASGIAGRSAEAVAALAARGAGIDVFVDERLVPIPGVADDRPPRPGAIRVQSAHDFVWRSARDQYDLAIYQAGNSRLHDFLWPYLFEWPGLVVLHDARLHHARGRALLVRRQIAEYRAEFAWNHPELPASAAELAVGGFDGPYYYQWPMLRRVADAARLLATHARGAVASLSEQWPRCPVEYIALGEGVATPLAAEARDEVRRAWNLPPDAIVFGVFGALTAEKRIPQILRAFRRTLARVPSARLVLAGPADPSIDVLAIAKELNISAAVLPLGSPDDAMFDLIVGSVDVSLNLRWPSAMETSGPWLRALAAGRPTVVIDLPHQTHVPALDPRTWRPLGDAGSGPAVTVAIDILDEDHSLALAMHRLATDHALRAQLGERAREYWRREHTVDRMVDDYVRAIDRACACPAPTRGALTGDPWRHTRELLAPFGPIECTLF